MRIAQVEIRSRVTSGESMRCSAGQRLYLFCFLFYYRADGKETGGGARMQGRSSSHLQSNRPTEVFHLCRSAEPMITSWYPADLISFSSRFGVRSGFNVSEQSTPACRPRWPLPSYNATILIKDRNRKLARARESYMGMGFETLLTLSPGGWETVPPQPPIQNLLRRRSNPKHFQQTTSSARAPLHRPVASLSRIIKKL